MEITDRIKLLMSYDSRKTLTENIELINEDFLTKMVRDGRIAASELEGVLKTMKADSKIANELKNSKEINSIKPGGVQTSDDLLKIISANKLSAEAKGLMNKSILQSNTKNIKMIEGSASDLVKSPQFAQKYFNSWKDGGRPGLEKALTNSKLYSSEAITQIVSQTEKNLANIEKLSGKQLKQVPENLKNLKGGSPEVKELIKNVPDVKDAVKNVDQVAVGAGKVGLNPSIYEKIGKKIGFYGAAGFAKIKNLASKMSFKKLVLYGIAGYGAYDTIKKLFGDDPNPSVLDPCVVNSDKIQLTTTSTGDVMGFIKTTGNQEYDSKGGLKFYSNGRVFVMDNSKKGKFSCSTGGQLKLSESTKNKKLNEESVLGNIEINWDIPGGGGEKKKFNWAESPSCDDVSKGVATIKKGMKGECVTKIQNQLKTKGFDEVGNPDGKFGGKTRSAIIRLQRNGGLNQTGVVDAATYKYLFFDNASTPEPETLTSKKVTSLPNETPEPTLNIPKVDDGTTLPSGAIGPLNQPNYPN
jgi:hypothetical protein